jgi:FkbM family methyltransferase
LFNRIFRHGQWLGTGNNSKIVKYNLDGLSIRLPGTHALPQIRKLYPAYGTNLGRVVQVVERKYPDLKLLDIGANVGDSVAIIRAKSVCPILCIEGFDPYFEFLSRNVSGVPHVELEKCYVGIKGLEMHGTVRPLNGTASVQLDPNGKKISMKTLREILEERPTFRCSRVWKIDTDGLDTEIIVDNMLTVAATRPVIFFEYDPYFLEKLKLDGFAVFEKLLGADYDQALFYENTGDYLLTASLSNKPLLKDLHEAQCGRGGLRYWDICVFPSEDSDLSYELRSEELEFFRELRNLKSV